MVNFPVKASASIADIYTPADGIYSLRDQRRLLSGTDWPPGVELSLSSLSLHAKAHNPDNSTASVTAPSGIIAGDLLIIQENGPDVTSSKTGNIPSGFTRIAISENAAVDQRVHYKVAAGNESGVTYAGQTGSNENMSIYVFRPNVPITSVTEIASEGTVDVNTNPSVNFSINPTGPSFAFLGAGSRSSSSVSIQNESPGSGWTIYDSINGSNLNEAEAFAWRFTGSGGSYAYSGGMTSSQDSRRTMLGGALELSSSASGASGLGDLYSNTNSYTFTGTQTSPTDLSLGISAGTVADFDLQFDIYTDQTNGTNEWVIQNNAYNATNGFLVGYYSTTYHGIAIAGDGIGAYGFNAPSNLPTGATTTVRVECRFSSAGTISVYHNGSLEGSQSGYSTTGVNWDYLYLGMGRDSTSASWANAFKGTISNIYISSA